MTPPAALPDRFAVVSDIHGNLPALQAVADHIAAWGVDTVLNLGDIVSGPLWPLETARWLMARGWPTLAGNHERQLLTRAPEHQGDSDARARRALGDAECAWLAGLPAHARWDPQVRACHGRPDTDLEYLLETPEPGAGDGSGLRAATPDELEARLAPHLPVAPASGGVLLCGHSHRPRLQRWRGWWLLNPGSVGLPAYDDDHGTPHRVENGSPAARWALAERGPTGWRFGLMATDYPHEQAAARAQAQGRPDWAHALRTGRVAPRGS